jgi:hypothetical protein
MRKRSEVMTIWVGVRRLGRIPKVQVSLAYEL